MRPKKMIPKKNETIKQYNTNWILIHYHFTIKHVNFMLLLKQVNIIIVFDTTVSRFSKYKSYDFLILNKMEWVFNNFCTKLLILN